LKIQTLPTLAGTAGKRNHIPQIRKNNVAVQEIQPVLWCVRQKLLDLVILHVQRYSMIWSLCNVRSNVWRTHYPIVKRFQLRSGI